MPPHLTHHECRSTVKKSRPAKKLTDIGAEILAKAARKKNVDLPHLGSQRMDDRHCLTLNTFKGNPFSKPNKDTPPEPSTSVVDCRMFPFPNGMNPREDTFMTDRAEAESKVDHALKEIFE